VTIAMHNTQRVHLPSHKLLAAVTKLVTMQHGGNRRSEDFKFLRRNLKTGADIAKQFGLNHRRISDRRTAIHANPE
jgi:hypothetical protein